MPLLPIIRPCPHCGSDHDINARINGDVVWCHFCGKWFRFVIRLNGSAYLAKCEPPPGTEPAQEPTADATLLAEMSAMRAELEAVKMQGQVLLVVMEQAQPVICSRVCPSIWKIGEDRPHSDLCVAMRGAIAKAHRETQ